MNRIFYGVLILGFGLNACTPAATSIPTPEATATVTPILELDTTSSPGGGIPDVTPTALPAPTLAPDMVSLAEPPGKLAFTSVVAGRRDVWLINANGNGMAEVQDAGGVNETQPIFSADSEKIYFISDANGSRALYAMTANGQNPELLYEADGEIYDPALSPDAGQLAFILELDGNPDVWLLDLTKDDASQLTFTPEIENAPIWWPDGSGIAFSRADGHYQDLVLLTFEPDAQGETEQTLTAGETSADRPQITPDGNHVIFQALSGSAPQLFRLDIATGAISRLTESGYNHSPALSPDGRWVTFVHEADFQRDLMTLDLETGQLTRLINDFLADDSPSYAPNGWQIAFASQRKSSAHWGIYLMNAEGNGLSNVTGELPASLFAEAPEWSPDGKWMAYDANYGGSRDIFLMPLGGGPDDVIHLVNRPGDDCYPAWSPDGSQIVFMGEVEGDREIFVINIDGTGLTRLTNELLEDYEPDWSPDGERIVFVSRRASNSDIYVMNADGTNVQLVSRGYGLDWRPAWSPDGEWIAFESWRDGDGDIYIVRPDGTDLTLLTENTDEDGHPTWSPDGSQIAFHSNRDGWYELYVLNVAHPEQVILVQTDSLRNLLPSWRP
jgi:Tol biopolymer transport system component